MITLVASAIGFATSFLPDLLGMWKAKQDNKHELAIMDKQIESSKVTSELRVQELEVQADISESGALLKHASPVGVKWVDALSASVRPILTYIFFGLFAYIKWTAFRVLVASGLDINKALQGIWDPETQALFAAIMSFWFGQRAMKHARKMLGT